MSDSIFDDPKTIKCLNLGFVRLEDHMGDDERIAKAAKVSYISNKDKTIINPKATRKLLRFMMAHRHTSPFEKVVFEFHMKMPIFIARQLIRHRTMSINEVSGRYSVMKEEFFIPELETLMTQSVSNKQGRDESAKITEEQKQFLTECIINSQTHSYEEYELMLGKSNDRYQILKDFPGLAKEMARINLPLALYTEWYMTINLHNLMHMLGLRQDSHAQFEIQVFANAMYELIKPIVPISIECYDNYHPNRNGRLFSGEEMDIIRYFISVTPDRIIENYIKEHTQLDERETSEFISKLKEKKL